MIRKDASIITGQKTWVMRLFLRFKEFMCPNSLKECDWATLTDLGLATRQTISEDKYLLGHKPRYNITAEGFRSGLSQKK